MTKNSSSLPLYRRRAGDATTLQSLLSLCLLGGIVLIVGCGDDQAAKPPGDSDGTEETVVELSEVERIVSSEELILALTPQLKKLNRSALNLKMPVGAARKMFAEKVSVVDIASELPATMVNDFVQRRDWSLAKTAPLTETGVWGRFFREAEFLNSARFYLIDGHFDKSGLVFESNMGFAAHAQWKDDGVAYATAKMKVVWTKNHATDLNPRISVWKTKEFHCLVSKATMFQEKMADCIADPILATQLKTSLHSEIAEKLILGEPMRRRKEDKYPFFFPEVTLEHPAVSVVDIDRDGFDDFFVARPHQPSLFFRNQGNGTFAEEAKARGIHFERDCTCSLFADFDNDGDSDVFIGRARKRAVYLENADGVFVDRSLDKINVDLPYMVSSICAADYDNNGLLDVYFSTYSPIEGSHGNIMAAGQNVWPTHFLNTIDLVEYRQRRAGAHAYLDMAGPPNVLLENRGETFAMSEHDVKVQSWRKSFQSGWCDFDQDGDQDLYVCNDFAPDDLYENNGPEGFRRVSDDLGLDQLGFGMGVSWDDHNKDGRFDLYVSNMYSKAGTRITAQVDGIDPRIRQMARGNYLYQWNKDRFDLVSVDGPQNTVAKTGWSWGGQFSDFDNDGWSDIIVANGYYSAPAAVAEQVDL